MLSKTATRIWYFFAILDGLVILTLWGRAILRSMGIAATPVQYLHVSTEIALCVATVLSVCGLIRGSRFAAMLSASVLASLIYLCFHTPDVAGDCIVLLLLAGSGFWGRRAVAH
jgi:hypothetical protein